MHGSHGPCTHPLAQMRSGFALSIGNTSGRADMSPTRCIGGGLSRNRFLGGVSAGDGYRHREEKNQAK